MEQHGFHYQVEARITFTGRDLITLFDASRGHYDHRCRMASNPANPATLMGGEIWGLLNRISGEIRPGETSEDLFRRTCTSNPTATVIAELRFRTLDLFAKILEPLGHVGGGAQDDHEAGLRLALRQALRSINAEYARMNPAENVRAG